MESKDKDEVIAGRHCFPYDHIKTKNPAYKHLEDEPIAYFCAEYGIEEKLPIYAGGLGILAGDTVLEAGELGVPMAAIGVMYHEGFPTYQSDEKSSDEKIDPKEAGFSPLLNDEGKRIVLDIEIGNDIVYVQVWARVYGSAHLFLLDTFLERNKEEYRAISKHLYSTDFRTKLLQDFILGIGGVKLLRCLGIEPSIYHLNEGHAAFAILALAVEYMHDHPDVTDLEEALDNVRHNIVGTKHTILPGAGLSFDRETFLGIVDGYLKRHNANFNDFFVYGSFADEDQTFYTTKLLIKGSARSNAVSLLHATFEKRVHPESRLLAVTNGINLKRWRAPKWGDNGINDLMDDDIWKIHEQNRADLLDFVEKRTEVKLDPSALTITWARRFAPYKRPELMFSDIEHLGSILKAKSKPVQILIAGLAHEADTEGRKLIKHIQDMTKDPKVKGSVVYLPYYDIKTAKMLVSGSDIWLSTPERGKEACGTSSMKAGLNGVLQLSTSDGWMEEVDWSDKGWVLPDIHTARHLYRILEEEIVPMFYERNKEGVPENWVQKMRLTISLIEKYYSSRRMLEDYMDIVYFPEEQ